MDKIELVEGIKRLPKFERKDIFLGENTNFIQDETHQAIVEIGKILPTYAFVTKSYSLIQFEDVFIPALESIGELDGDLKYANGFALIDVFPKIDSFNQGETKYGLVVTNSVDMSSAVNVRFVIKHQNNIITIPKSVTGLKQIHVGKSLKITTEYIETISKIKLVWNDIITKFTEMKVDDELVASLTERIKVDKHAIELIKENMKNHELNLWDCFDTMIDVTLKRKYKNEINRRKKLDKISASIFDFSAALRI